ncbi:MAG: hypothetical protein ACXVCV_17690, partial [Polyangia bacterium]
APPRAFVAERKRIADELKAAGRLEEARAAAKLKRPSASVWAVNQLARRAPDELAELLELGASLRAGERKLMRGGSAGDFMADARTARQKVAALSRRAEQALREAGQQQVTLSLARKIAQTLHAAGIGDDETRAKLEAGRLEEDLQPPSTFGGDSTNLAAALAASVAARPRTQAAHAERKRADVERKRTLAAQEEAAAGKPPARGAGDDRAAARAHAEVSAATAARKRAAAARKQAAAALRDERRAQAAARKLAAMHARAVAAADRLVVERKRAVEKARASVERAEVELRAAKDALAEAETAAAAAHRAADDAD